MQRSAGFLTAVLMLWIAIPSAFAASRPNIVLLITDDQRHDQIGFANRLLHTPEMDRLAAHGVRFDNAFATTPICAASRASMLCGLVERTHRYTFRTPPFAGPFVEISFPKLLRQAGYRTAYVGKFGVTLEPGAGEQLYDSFRPLGHPYWKKQSDGSMRHLTDIEADAAIEFLENHGRAHGNQPFCLTIGFNAPHAEDAAPQQYFWQQAVDPLYRDITVPKPPLSDPGFYRNLPEFLRDGTMNRHRWRWRFDFESKRQEMTKGYWRMISGVDLAIRRLRETLDASNLSTNTVILFTSDNGYFLGERGYAGKWLPYEPSIRVPLIVFDPRRTDAKGGTHRAEFALNIDIAPTILDFAEVAIPNVYQGRSLVPLTRGEKVADWRREVWLEHLMMEPSIRKHEGIRTERYKYARYFEADPLLEELYDLETDPLETVNLINSPKHQRILTELRSRTDALRDEYGGEFSERIWKQRHGSNR